MGNGSGIPDVQTDLQMYSPPPHFRSLSHDWQIPCKDWLGRACCRPLQQTLTRSLCMCSKVMVRIVQFYFRPCQSWTCCFQSCSQAQGRIVGYYLVKQRQVQEMSNSILSCIFVSGQCRDEQTVGSVQGMFFHNSMTVGSVQGNCSLTTAWTDHVAMNKQ